MGSNMSVCLSDGTSRNLKTGSDFSSFIQDDKNDPKLCDNVVLKSLSDDEKCLTKELTDIAWKKLLESNKQIFDQVDIPQLDEEFKDDEEESDSEQSVLTELNPTNSPKCPKSPKYPSM